ncbi:MAG: hypothetical protein IT513_18745 [Burkholderiales bacterium]|nr:hypothetical protein [Burkholderiales bacterium]
MMRIPSMLLLACALALSGAARAADIVRATYDPASDELVVEIAYRGANPGHDFVLNWDACDGAHASARLADRQGSENARQDFMVSERFGLADLPCRPASVTLRLGRTAHASVDIPAPPPRN